MVRSNSRGDEEGWDEEMRGPPSGGGAFDDGMLTVLI